MGALSKHKRDKQRQVHTEAPSAPELLINDVQQATPAKLSASMHGGDPASPSKPVPQRILCRQPLVRQSAPSH